MLRKILCVGLLSFASIFSTIVTANDHLGLYDFDLKIKTLTAKAQNLDPQVLKLGLQAYLKARQQGFDPQQLLTIVDYTKPSTEPRMWVIDIKNNDVLFQELVAHGKNSGNTVATTFSNQPRSLKSSLGVFLTQNTYIGRHGYSLRLSGLERGFNDMALLRDIVVHAAAYVSRLSVGRSWGCFALNPVAAKSVIDTIKDGTVIFAYYPDKKWLSHSKFLS